MKATARTRTSASTLASATDTALFEGLAEGDLGPLGELFDRHHVAVRALAQRLLINPADADDLVQETFLTASRAAASFEPGAAARPFLLGIAAQLARRRRRGFARLRAMIASLSEAPLAPGESPEDAAVAVQTSELLQASLARLSDDHREILLLVDLSGLSGVEAARALGVPAGTVWRRLHEARHKLRDIHRRRIG